MSSRLFAFTVSKKIEQTGAQAQDQWVGDQTARAQSTKWFCSGGQGYGLAGCDVTILHTNCRLWGGTGYYICDAGYPN